MENVIKLVYIMQQESPEKYPLKGFALKCIGLHVHNNNNYIIREKQG